MALQTRKSHLWLYLFFAAWIILMFLLGFYLSPVSIFIIFLGLIFIPGFALSRIFKIQYQNDRFGQLILTLVLGLEFNFTLILAAILLGLTIAVLLKIYLIFFGLIFILALILDILKPPETKPLSWRVKDLFKAEYLVYVLLAILILAVLITVDYLGANFVADPFYNLAIIRKAFEGQPLLMQNLSYNKYSLHPAFALPIWHVFLALFTKILGTNIFVVYREIPTSLSLLAFLVWYWLFLKILPNRRVAVLGTLLVIIYYLTTSAYLYTRLPVPDTLNELFLMPLAFAVTLKYIFAHSSNFKHLIVLILFTLFMGIIHWNHYFQFLFTMALFTIIYAILQWRSGDFKKVFKKIFIASFGSVILAGLVFLLFESKGGTISEHLQIFPNLKMQYRYIRFVQFDQFLKYAYIFLPFLVLGIRKYRQLIFTLALFLIGPIIFNFPGVKDFLINHLSSVFVKRFYANNGWPFVVWAIVIGFIFVLFDRLISKITQKLIFWRYLIDGILIALVIIAFYTQLKFATASQIYQRIFSPGADQWLNHYYQWLIPIVLIMVLIIYFLARYNAKINDFFVFSHYQDEVFIFGLIALLTILLASPAISLFQTNVKKDLSQKHFIRSQEDPTFSIVDTNDFGGMATIDFIRQNIPAKADFDSNSANYVLPLMVDVFTIYTFDPDPIKKYKDLYENIPIQKKLAILKEGKIDYILYVFPDPSGSSPFDSFGQYFMKIYDNGQAAIFKINKTTVNAAS